MFLTSILFFIFFIGAGLVQAAVEIGDLSLDAQVFSGSGTHGYAEYGVTVTNHSAKQDHEVTLVLPAEGGSRGGNRIARLSRSVIIGAKSTATVRLYQPCLEIMGNNILVQVDGVTSDEAIPISTIRPNLTAFQSWNSREACLLVSRGVGGRFGDEAEKRYEKYSATSTSPSSMPSRSRRGGVYVEECRPSVNRAEVSVEEWSPNWLAYTRYSMMIVTNEEFEHMPAEVRAALFGYLRTGGTLLVQGKTQVPKELKLNQIDGKEGMSAYPFGFGQLLVSAEADVEKWSPKQWDDWFLLLRQEEDPWYGLNNAFGGLEESEQFNENRLPLRGMFGLMILFAVVIGPVNLFVLSWKRRRTWLLWTTPAISLVTCLAVFGYNFVVEGWHSRVYLDGLTILDEANHRATTLGWARYYCPLTPGGGLHFDTETEVTPIYDNRNYWDIYHSGTAKSLDWTTDQNLVNGWVIARSPTYYLFRKDAPRRERLVVRKTNDGKMIVSNSLGAAIKRLTLVDRDGTNYAAENLKAGAEGVLKNIGKGSKSIPIITLPDLFQERLGRRESIAVNPTSYLRPGTYVAVLEGSPFMETGLGGKVELKGESVVYGIMKGAE